MSGDGGVERAINVAVCHRIGGKQSILVCANCYNEIEGRTSEFFVNEVAFDVDATPRYNFCPWCSAPLREADDG